VEFRPAVAAAGLLDLATADVQALVGVRGHLAALAVMLAAVWLAGGVSARTVVQPQVPAAAVVKRCPAGYVRAVIGGKRKCLKAGQFCARRFDRQYHRYGFHCHGKRLTRRKTPPAPSADLALSVVAAPDPAKVGAELSYQITVTNAGPSPSVSVRVSTEQLPSAFAGGSLQLVRSDAPVGCSLLGPTFSCELGDVASGATATATVVVRPTATGTVSTQWFAASAATTPTRDPNQANNSASVTTTVAS
jgi:uncharacterized repeat protein (TIGR01451 family)